MAVNSIEGSNQYTNTQTVDATGGAKGALKDQNMAAAGTDLDENSAALAQEAFKVNITEEARGMQQAGSEETASLRTQTGAGEMTGETNQPSPEQNASRIVNIVA